MEACGTAHFWGREAQARGHRVVLLPPHAVRPYVLRNKTDGADAKGLLEARAQRGDPPRAGEVGRSARARGAAPPALGLDGDAHGAAQHAARAAARARLRDPGRRAPGRAARVGARVRRRLGASRRAAARARRGRARDRRARGAHPRGRARSSRRWRARAPVVARLRTIPGVGLLTATALVAFVGDVAALPVRPPLRELPRAHAARVVERPAAAARSRSASAAIPTCACCSSTAPAPCCCHAKKSDGAQRDRLRTWALERERARGHNKAAVALANKLARIVWAVWRHERAYGAVHREANA